jgi:glycosyltransferase involved in cell wall biosynthesis
LRAGEPPVILGVGRLTVQKDFPTLIRAFARVRQKRNARLLILGEGELRSELNALVAELGLQADVALPGFVENPFVFMRHASLFVLSSAWEGFGNVLVEAMACGMPVVSTDCPSGPAEILQNGKWGRLVPVGDVQALSEALLATLEESTHPDVAARAAECSVDRAVEGYLRVRLPSGGRSLGHEHSNSGGQAS